MMLVRDNRFIPERDKDFFILLRAGLWQRVEEPLSESPDWGYILRLSEEQAVVGIIGDGLSLIRKEYPEIDRGFDLEIYCSFIIRSTEIVKSNVKYNELMCKLSDMLWSQDIRTLVVKGQNCGLNYPKPSLRACGDIDFLLRQEDFEKAKALLAAKGIVGKDTYNYHWESTVDDIPVELHSFMHTTVYNKANRMINQWQEEMFNNGDFVKKNAEGSDAFFVAPNNRMDILFTFCHIIKHVVQGLGIRQFCDLCMALHSYEGKYDKEQIRTDIKTLGVEREWSVFTAFCVEFLGLPSTENVIFDDKLHKYATNLWDSINNNGSFGRALETRIEKESNRFRKNWIRTRAILIFSPISIRLTAIRMFKYYQELFMLL